MSGAPDFKPEPRIVDRTATKRALLRYPTCLACGERASNGHHVLGIGRGQTGDDLTENIVGLCGTGTTLCHGAFHGNPYVHRRPMGRILEGEPGEEFEERRDREWVARRIGERLPTSRPDVITYVLGKLGAEAGADFLERVYYVPASAMMPQ